MVNTVKVDFTRQILADKAYEIKIDFIGKL
jgi:hypothetical protein